MYAHICVNKVAWKWVILKKYNQHSTTPGLIVSYLSRLELNGDEALCLTCSADSGPWYRQKLIRQAHTIFLEHSSCFVKCDSPEDLDIFKGSRNKEKPMPVQSQEATVRSRHGTMDWFKIENAGRQGCILSPCLFNLWAEYILQNARLDDSQTGIKIAGRIINNLRYVDYTTLMAESKEELKSLLIRVKRRVKMLA